MTGGAAVTFVGAAEGLMSSDRVPGTTCYTDIIMSHNMLRGTTSVCLKGRV